MKRMQKWTIAAMSLAVAAPMAWAEDAEVRTETRVETRVAPAEEAQIKTEHQAGAMIQHAPLAKANELIGKNVKNAAGEQLGQIRDIVMDVNEGRIGYAVLGFGGFLRLGEDYFPIPWQALSLRHDEAAPGGRAAVDVFTGTGDTHFVLNIERERLRAEQGFDRDNWPNMADQQWAEQIHVQYGLTPYWQQRQDRQERVGEQPGEQARVDMHPEHPWVNRLSQIIGTRVRDQADNNIGRINEVMIDLREGRIAYAVVEYGGTLGVGDRLAAVPWAAITVRPEDRVVAIAADEATLDRMSFSRDRWPEMGSEEWARRTHEHFGAEPYWETYGYDRPDRADMGAGWGAQSEYNRLYSDRNLETIEGTVKSVGMYRLTADAAPGMTLTVESRGQLWNVHLGPANYAQAQNFRPAVEQQIKVTGAKAQFEGQEVLIAREAELEGRRVEFRSEQGEPRWGAGDLQRQELRQDAGETHTDHLDE